MIRHTLIDLNAIGLDFYPVIMITLKKCNRSSNVVNDFFIKICALSKTKEVNAKEFNTIKK